MANAMDSKAWRQRLKPIPWLHALLKARYSDAMTAFTGKRRQKREENAGRDIVRLLLIILVASLAVIIGIFFGIESLRQHRDH